MNYAFMVILIPCICFGGFNLRSVDSLYNAKKQDQMEALEARSQTITRTSGRNIIDHLKGYIIDDTPKQQVALTPPDELFKPAVAEPARHRSVKYNYASTGNYLTKKDFNTIIDSMTQEFSKAIRQTEDEIASLNKVCVELLNQSESSNDRWENIMDLISGGSLTALLTAIGGLIVVLRRKK